MPESQRLARAKRTYERTWARAAPAYGANPADAPPQVTYEPGPIPLHTGATTGMVRDESGAAPEVQLSRGEVMALSRPKSLAKKEARRVLLHEWAHVYQTPGVIANETDREIGANAFANYYGKRLFRAPGGDILRELPGQEYLKKYGPGFWRRGQFGSNYGADPTAIRYPGA